VDLTGTMLKIPTKLRNFQVTWDQGICGEMRTKPTSGGETP